MKTVCIFCLAFMMLCEMLYAKSITPTPDDKLVTVWLKEIREEGRKKYTELEGINVPSIMENGITKDKPFCLAEMSLRRISNVTEGITDWKITRVLAQYNKAKNNTNCGNDNNTEPVLELLEAIAQCANDILEYTE
ncbi:uncharacterized protein LOC144542471 [Centroberyx gerrardi]